jgi:hypothetical protein
MANTVRVRALVNHTAGAAWCPKGHEYDEEAERARDKARRGVVEIVTAAKAARPAENKADAPAANKARRGRPRKAKA